jgi:hypothetical protein
MSCTTIPVDKKADVNSTTAISCLAAAMNPKEELPVRTAACTALGLVIQQDQSNQDKLRNTKGAIESLVGTHSSCASPRAALWSCAASHVVCSLSSHVNIWRFG